MIATYQTSLVREAVALRRCPNCGGTRFERMLRPERIHQEIEYRERFIFERLEGRPSPSELKDLTEFAHQNDVAILCCSDCGVLVRDESPVRTERSYVNDHYDRTVLDRLFPRYAQAFRAKGDPYRGLLQPGARVLEIGSHLGAFLETAREWGWRADGVDIGKDTAAYARSRGFRVQNRPLEDCGFADETFDGVFIWNCFEQVPDPSPLLDEARRVLRERGLLVVRTPNSAFYDWCESLLQDSGLFETQSAAAEFALKAMGYNNLLAFPYLYGYNSANLNDLVIRHGFRREGALNSELLTLPLPAVPAWVAEEQREVNASVARMNEIAQERHRLVLTGPWIELYFTASDTRA